MIRDEGRRARRHGAAGRTSAVRGRMRMARFGALALAYGGAIAALLAAGAGVVADATGPGPLRPDAAVAVGGLVAAWACLAWWGLAFAASVLGALPNRLGRLARACAERIAPAAIRRIARYALGAALASGATIAVPLGPASAASGPVPSADPAPVLPSLDRPTGFSVADPLTPTAAGPAVATGPRPVEAAQTCTRADDREDATGPTRRATPAAAAHRDGVRTPRSLPAGEVTVRTGDTLWAIAARHLPPDASVVRIAEEWPRWYRANAEVIGADPDLIRPGERLRPAPIRPRQNAEETR